MTDITAQLSAALAGRYRIERRLGEGGMATVYLAEDLRHGRKVALKVLRPELGVVIGGDRFLQEIRTTARLQHPHILPLYDSGNTASTPDLGTGLLYYVMPYIEGETLRAKLERERQLGIDEAVKIASEVADALQYAHEQGVIHRDIKPENVMLRDGRAYVADFGIALAVSAAAGGRMTETGLSLGTPHYMSPEQAMADAHIDKRSDIYSLGAVLFELLAGEPPHTGPSAQVVFAKILADDARPLRELRKAVPPHVAAVVAKALEKLPADRFETAKAFAAALQDPDFTQSGASAAHVLNERAPRRGTWLPALASGAVLVAAAALWSWSQRDGAPAAARFPTTLDAAGVLDGLTLGVEAALSPDGASLVYRSPLTGPGQLFLKRRDEVAARPLAGTEGGSGPFFSPDGAWIGFVANGQLRRIPAAGGATMTLTDSVDAVYNRAAWLDNGSIVFYDAPTRTLRMLRPGETKATVIITREMLDGRFPWLPSALPASRGFLFTAHLTECVGPVSCRPSRVYVYDARRDTVRALFDDAIGAWHVPTGHVLYLTSSGTLMAAPWDNSSLATTGRAEPVMDGIQAPGFLISNEGTAYYTLGRSEFAPGPLPNAMLVWVDRSGRIEPVDSSWQVNTGGRFIGTMESEWGLALSPDGRRIALTMLTELGTDIWIKQLPSGPATRLTTHAGVDRSPAWTPDGRSVIFVSDRGLATDSTERGRALRVWEQRADGVGDARLVSELTTASDARLSPDSRWLVVDALDSTGTESQREIVALRQGAESLARRIAAPGSRVSGATLSPDSRWIAYVSNEQGVDEVFVRPFPDVNAGKWQVSSGGGSAPLWAHSGRELFYVADRKMHVVRVQPSATFSAEPPRVLFAIPEGLRSGSPYAGTFAITPDDRRFLMVRDNSWAEMAGSPQLVVVQNFFAELRAKLKQ